MFAAMIIGFTERIRTVSEGARGEVDIFLLLINVFSLRTSEREHPMVFRVKESSATVETLIPSSFIFDATFGFRGNLDNSIEESRNLLPGKKTISLETGIRNDLIAENEECFTIQILPIDVLGRRELFSCNTDDQGSYFCKHTICINDDDGTDISVQFYVLKVCILANCSAVRGIICGDSIHC